MKDKIKKEEVNKVDNREIERYEKIVDRANKEIAGVRYVYIWLAGILGIIFVVGMGVATFITYSTIGDIKSSVEERVSKLEKRVEERIEEQFDRHKIRKLVEDKAIERIDKLADKLIGEKIDEKATPLIRQLQIQVGDLHSRLVAIDEKIDQIMAGSRSKLRALERATEQNLKAMQIESKFLLTVLRAQIGDKKSWLELGQIAEREQGTERGEFAVGAIRRIYDDFFKTGFQRSMYYLPSVSDSEVVEFLKHNWPHKRKQAVYTIKKRLMYDQIPALISMVPLEENLDVLGEIYRVLNELLGTDIKITQVDNALRFNKAWEAKKLQINKSRRTE